MAGRLIAGLAHAGVEPQVADQVPVGEEAGDVADRRHERKSDRALGAGDGEQALDLGAREADLRQLALDERELLAGDVGAPQRRGDRDLLVEGQHLLGEPGPTFLPKRSAAEQRDSRLRCRMACTWFLRRVRSRTIELRRETSRRSASRSSSGRQMPGR